MNDEEWQFCLQQTARVSAQADAMQMMAGEIRRLREQVESLTDFQQMAFRQQDEQTRRSHEVFGDMLHLALDGRLS